MTHPDRRVVRIDGKEYVLICDPATPTSRVLRAAVQLAEKEEERLRAEVAYAELHSKPATLQNLNG